MIIVLYTIATVLFSFGLLGFIISKGDPIGAQVCVLIIIASGLFFIAGALT